MNKEKLWLGAVLGAFIWLITAPAAWSTEPVADWVETDRVQFSGTDGFFRSQGVASDGNSIFFSWNLGLSRTEIDDTSVVLADNTTKAIPTDMGMTGHNHIGDIDVSKGIIYAPIEDGPKYLAPWIVLYDADTLEPTGDRYLLPASVQRDGVPWIAVDEPRQVAYSMEWGDTGKLFVYRLSDFELVQTVTLSEPVSRIQGAKMFRGHLYASRDNGSEKSIVAIDPATGQVTKLFDRNLGDDYEAEGIAFARRSTGTMMLATGIREGGDGYTDMRIYRIGGDQTAPVLSRVGFVKSKVRPGKKLSLRVTSSEEVTAGLRWEKCVGPKRRPCTRTRSLGLSHALTIPTGTTRHTVVPNYARNGKKPVRLAPGKWRLNISTVDRADIVGNPVVTGLTVIKTRR